MISCPRHFQQASTMSHSDVHGRGVQEVMVWRQEGNKMQDPLAETSCGASRGKPSGSEPR
eukprot:8606074-Heterocapsa_arctica.AAC.1